MQTKTNPDVRSLHGTSDLKVEKRKLKNDCMCRGSERNYSKITSNLPVSSCSIFMFYQASKVFIPKLRDIKSHFRR
jgi:hypothetical protein